MPGWSHLQSHQSNPKQRRSAIKQIRLLGYSLGITLLLAGCSTIEELFDEPFEASETSQAASTTRGNSRDGARPLAPLSHDGTPLTGSPGSTTPRTLGAGQPGVTGTFAGNNAQQIGGEAANLQQSAATRSSQFEQTRNTAQGLAEQFHGMVTGIKKQLEGGAATGTPFLKQQWETAQAKLGELTANLRQLEELRSHVATDAASSASLQEQVQIAYRLSGAVAADDRLLAKLEKDINRTAISVERLLTRIEVDVARQGAYIASERLKMTTLARTIERGGRKGSNGSSSKRSNTAKAAASPPARESSTRRALANSTPGTAASQAKARPKADMNARSAQKPIMVIDFATADPAYEANLYAAISEVVARNPAAAFEVVAVTPGAKPGASATASRRNAEKVVRSLVSMGVPRARLRETEQINAVATTDQVLVYAL